MKKLTLLLGGVALGAVVALVPTTGHATLIGSVHDFSPTGFGGVAGSLNTNGYATFVWGGETNTYNNPCQVCHIPHKAQKYSDAKAPLWNHQRSSSAYITYDSAGSVTFNALNLTVALGSSTACLSCHDGSVAINQTQNGTGRTATNGTGGLQVFAPSWSIETVGGSRDLTQMHPIGVSYTDARTASGTELNDPSGDDLLNKTMLKGSTKNVECASCHDIHRTQGASDTVSHELIVNLEGGALCLRCHNK